MQINIQKTCRHDTDRLFMTKVASRCKDVPSKLKPSKMASQPSSTRIIGGGRTDFNHRKTNIYTKHRTRNLSMNYNTNFYLGVVNLKKLKILVLIQL